MTLVFDATLSDRKWMKAAKAWRLFFDIPADNSEAPVVLTSLIESNVRAHINHAVPAACTVLAPAHVVDVPHKAKKFTLILETCNEAQNAIGTLVTPLMGDRFNIQICGQDDTPPATKHQERRGTIDEKSIKGLHTGFFQNRKFWEFLSERTGEKIDNPVSCKAIYKVMMQVSSCTQINQHDFDANLQEFNAWLAK
jgi:hypothetical protein